MIELKATPNATTADIKRTFHLNLALRIGGSFYAAYSLAMLIKLALNAKPISQSPIDLCVTGILVLFLVLGLAMLGRVESFSISPSNQTYTLRKGVWPFVKQVSGHTSEIRSIALLANDTPISDGDSGAILPLRVVTANIVWSDDRQPLPLFGERVEGNRMPRVIKRASDLASYLGCQLEDLR